LSSSKTTPSLISSGFRTILYFNIIKLLFKKSKPNLSYNCHRRGLAKIILFCYKKDKYTGGAYFLPIKLNPSKKSKKNTYTFVQVFFFVKNGFCFLPSGKFRGFASPFWGD
jgi:hypothetical protein